MRPPLEPEHAGKTQPGAQRQPERVAKPPRKQGAKQKIANGLLALSSAAVMAVYAAGYVHTASAASAASITAPIAIVSTTTTPVSAIASVAAQSATAVSSAYRDGTYTGSGTSPHGGVTVAVVIANGTITSVEITASNTRYPISRIAALPGEVVTAQSATIDFVSGATDSSRAFQTAVASALAQAQAA